MLVWDQSAGELSLDGTFKSKGYSGRNRGKNNPAMQNAVGIGPIPQGLWNIVAVENRPDDLGPVCIKLEPAKGTNTFGRSGFYAHGDSIKNPGTASHGCIILPRAIRDWIVRMWKAGTITQIRVVE